MGSVHVWRERTSSSPSAANRSDDLPTAFPDVRDFEFAKWTFAATWRTGPEAHPQMGVLMCNSGEEVEPGGVANEEEARERPRVTR